VAPRLRSPVSRCAAPPPRLVVAPRHQVAQRRALVPPSEMPSPRPRRRWPAPAIVPTDFPYRGSVVPPSRTRPDARRTVGRPPGRSVTPLGLPLIDSGQPNACDQKCRHVVDVVPVPLGPLIIRFGLSLPHHTTSLTFRLDVHRGRTLRPPSPARPPLQPTLLNPNSRHSHCSNPHQPSHSHTFPLHLTQNTAATVSSTGPSTPPSRPSRRGVSPPPPTAATSRTPPIHL
jgi:hypothetical protein